MGVPLAQPAAVDLGQCGGGASVKTGSRKDNGASDNQAIFDLCGDFATNRTPVLWGKGVVVANDSLVGIKLESMGNFQNNGLPRLSSSAQRTDYLRRIMTIDHHEVNMAVMEDPFVYWMLPLQIGWITKIRNLPRKRPRFTVISRWGFLAIVVQCRESFYSPISSRC